MARNLGEEYTLEASRRRILVQTVEKSTYSTWTEPRKPKQVSIVVRGNVKKARKISGLRGLYLHYCYLLGILPKNRPPVNPKQLHFLLREDLRKLDTISKETRLLCHYHIDTAEQLFSLKEDFEERISQLSDERKYLRYQSRNIQEPERLSEVRAEIEKLTENIRKLRKEAGLCDGIATRSGVIKEKMKTIQQEKVKEKEEVSYEHIRRSR